MRFLLVLLALVVLVVAAALMLGFVSLDQTRPLAVQAPAYKAEVGTVQFGTHNETVAVPDVHVTKPANSQAPAQ